MTDKKQFEASFGRLDDPISDPDESCEELAPDKLYLDERHYDYTNQAWIVNGRYKSCAHPGSMHCQCYGRLHAGELALETSAKKG